MAIAHFSARIVGRCNGSSVVLSAGYRHYPPMDFEREGRSVDYFRKPGLLHEEFVIAADALD